MMTRSCLLLALLIGPLTLSYAQPIDFSVAGIKEGLRRSPNDYIAAVVAVRDQAQCVERGSGKLCWVRAVIVEEIASRHPGGFPKTFLLASGDTPGTWVSGKSIVFAVPIGETGVYGSTAASVFGKGRLRSFREAVNIALHGRQI
jgi:hypothetical protein